MHFNFLLIIFITKRKIMLLKKIEIKFMEIKQLKMINNIKEINNKK